MSYEDFYDYDSPGMKPKLDTDELLASLERTQKDTQSKQEQQPKSSLDIGESNESDVYSGDSPTDDIEIIDPFRRTSDEVLNDPKDTDSKEKDLHPTTVSTDYSIEDALLQFNDLEKKLGISHVPESSTIDKELLSQLAEALKPFNKDYIKFFSFINKATQEQYDSTSFYEPRMSRELFLLTTIALLYEEPENYIYMIDNAFYNYDPLFNCKSVIAFIIDKANKYFLNS